MAHVCIFCQQQKKMSNEHIFPQWLQKYLRVRDEILYISSTDREEPHREMVYDKHLNGRVCIDCNNGWMSQIEGDVKPILISMLECSSRSSIHIAHNQSMLLAWWVYKTVLTLHSASPYLKVIPQRHYELVFNQKAPANFGIAITHCSVEIPKPTWIQNQNWIGASRFISKDNLKDELKKTYRITFGFGNFVARVHYFPLRFRLMEYEQDSVHCIHPGNQAGFNWPLPASIQNIEELDQSITITGDPEQDAAETKRLWALSLNFQEDSEEHEE